MLNRSNQSILRNQSNLLRRFTLAVCLISISFGIFWLFILPRRSKQTETLRIPYAYTPGATHFEPREIQWSYEYDIVNNLFGKLLRRDKNNEISVDLPERMQVGDKTATFYFGSKTRTSKGDLITAKDAEYSIKRLFMHKIQKFSWVRKAVCADKDLTSVDDFVKALRLPGELSNLKFSLPLNSPCFSQL